MQEFWKPRAIPGESPAGLLLRYTSKHVEQPAYILKHSGFAASNLPAIISSLFRGETKLLDKIADTSNWSISPTMATAAKSRQHLRWLNSKRCTVCPDCVSEGFLPASHDWRCMEVCTRHQLVLQASCISCNKAYTWSRPGLGLCSCFQEIDQRIPASESALSFAKAVEQCIDANDLERLTFLMHAHEKLRKRYGSGIDTQTIAVALAKGNETPLINAIARFAKAHPTFPLMIIALPAMGFFESATRKQLYSELNKAMKKLKKAVSLPETFQLNALELSQAMQCKPETVKALIRSMLSDDNGEALKRTLNLGELSRVFESLQPKVDSKPSESSSLKELASLSDKTIGEWLVATIKGAHHVTAWDRSDFSSIEINTAFNPHSDVPSGYLTLAQARTYLGLYDVAMTSIRQANLVNVIAQKNRFGRYLFEKSSLDSFMNTYATGGQLAKHWGVPATNLSEKLIALGIEPVSGPDIDGSKLYIFRRLSVEHITKNILDEISANYARSGRKMGDPQRYDAKKWIPAIDAAASLNISVQALKDLVRPGLLVQGTPKNAGSRSTRYFSVASVQATANYLERLVLIDDLSITCDLPRKQLVRRANKLIRNAIIRYRGKDWVSSEDAETLILHCSRLWSAETAAQYWACSHYDIGNWARLGHIKAIGEYDQEYLGSPKLFLSSDVKSLNIPGSTVMRANND